MTKTYWYKFETHYCPCCGSEKVYMERQYSPKPKDRQKRYVFCEVYDYCLGF